jgi:outer membrane protein assembly factor BamB
MNIRHLDTLVRLESMSVVLVVSCILSLCASGSAQAAPRLVSDSQARHLGLAREWNAQVRVNAARNEVERAVLEGDRLTVLTSAGLVHEFDALTGRTIWVAPVGNPDHPSLGPAASDKYVALLNGSTLFVLDRADGKPIIVRPVGGAPGAAPAVGQNYVFVPLAVGRIEGYPLGEQKLTPWYYQSYGRAMVPPLATPESFVWTTDSGHLYVGRGGENLGVRFRLETGSDIVAPPAYGAQYVYVATDDGEVFSMHELTGNRRWKYATGFPIARAPAVVGNKVYVTSDEPMLHCIDAEKGTGLWEAPHIKQFAAASANRVYAVDDLGSLVVLDASNGTVLGRIPTDSSTHALVNDQTDRIYLVSKDGVIQCLHEIGSPKPMYHQPKVQPEAPKPTEQPAVGATVPSQPSTDEAAEEPADETDEPASEEPAEEMEDAAPAGESGDEDPFGDL